MRPEITAKISEVAGPNFDLSVLDIPSDTPTGVPETGMPEISVITIYDDIKDRIAILSSDELIELIGLALQDRLANQSIDTLSEELPLGL